MCFWVHYFERKWLLKGPLGAVLRRNSAACLGGASGCWVGVPRVALLRRSCAGSFGCAWVLDVPRVAFLMRTARSAGRRASGLGVSRAAALGRNCAACVWMIKWLLDMPCVAVMWRSHFLTALTPYCRRPSASPSQVWECAFTKPNQTKPSQQ